jgi:type II secretory pathway predicted ATPase ExeA
MKTSSYLEHFGLRQAPFSKELDDTSLWLPTSKQELLDDLEHALRERQSVLLMGEPGVGKTCVLRALRHRVEQVGGFRLTYCPHANLSKRDFYRLLCHTLGLATTSSAANLYMAVETYVHSSRRDKLHPVFLLDEAQHLKDDMLDHLHIMLNYEWDSMSLLSVVLVGLPDMESRLSLRNHRSLWTRVQHRLLIEPANEQDTAEYLQFRLSQAGSTQALFPDDAIRALHESSQGALRELDRLGAAALRDAAKRKKRLVDRESVQRVAEPLTKYE